MAFKSASACSPPSSNTDGSASSWIPVAASRSSCIETLGGGGGGGGGGSSPSTAASTQDLSSAGINHLILSPYVAPCDELRLILSLNDVLGASLAPSEAPASSPKIHAELNLR